jgi:hypothetical protein
MFLIPKYKNIYEWDDYGPKSDSLMDYKYRQNTMSNNAYLVWEWKFTPKTSITIGGQLETFNDFNTASENYFHTNATLQLMIKDRYAGLNMILTTGVAKYYYDFYNSRGATHLNPLNSPFIPASIDNPYNPNRVTGNISSYDFFLRIYCGF